MRGEYWTNTRPKLRASTTMFRVQDALHLLPLWRLSRSAASSGTKPVLSCLDQGQQALVSPIRSRTLSLKTLENLEKMQDARSGKLLCIPVLLLRTDTPPGVLISQAFSYRARRINLLQLSSPMQGSTRSGKERNTVTSSQSSKKSNRTSSSAHPQSLEHSRKTLSERWRSMWNVP